MTRIGIAGLLAAAAIAAAVAPPRPAVAKPPDGVPTWGRWIWVEKQLSRTRCVRGDSWGADSSGIGVDRGCAAVFGVG